MIAIPVFDPTPSDPAQTEKKRGDQNCRQPWIDRAHNPRPTTAARPLRRRSFCHGSKKSDAVLLSTSRLNTCGIVQPEITPRALLLFHSASSPRQRRFHKCKNNGKALIRGGVARSILCAKRASAIIGNDPLCIGHQELARLLTRHMRQGSFVGRIEWIARPWTGRCRRPVQLIPRGPVRREQGATGKETKGSNERKDILHVRRVADAVRGRQLTRRLRRYSRGASMRARMRAFFAPYSSERNWRISSRRRIPLIVSRNRV